MESKVVKQGNAVVIALDGELDVSVAPQLKSLLKETIESGASKLVVDMRGVKFIDSACLGVMVNAHRLSVEKKARIVFAQSSESVRKIFELTRADRHLAFYPSIDEALKSFASS